MGKGGWGSTYLVQYGGPTPSLSFIHRGCFAGSLDPPGQQVWCAATQTPADRILPARLGQSTYLACGASIPEGLVFRCFDPPLPYMLQALGTFPTGAHFVFSSLLHVWRDIDIEQPALQSHKNTSQHSLTRE